MIPLALALVIAILAVVLIYALLRGFLSHPRNLAEFVESLQPINLKSMLHLSNSSDDEFLRMSLPSREYRKLRRLRSRVTLQYYRTALKNCSLLRGYGELLQANTDTKTCAFGQELCSAAFGLRLALIRGSCIIFFCLIFPFEVRLASISDHYEEIGRQLKAFTLHISPELSTAIGHAFSIS